MWLLWQIYAPKILHVDTRFHEIVTNFNDRIDAVGERIDDVEEQQSKIVAITEIIAVETDSVNGDTVEEVLRDEEVIARDDLVGDSGYYSRHEKHEPDIDEDVTADD